MCRWPIFVLSIVRAMRCASHHKPPALAMLGRLSMCVMWKIGGTAGTVIGSLTAHWADEPTCSVRDGGRDAGLTFGELAAASHARTRQRSACREFSRRANSSSGSPWSRPAFASAVTPRSSADGWRIRVAEPRRHCWDPDDARLLVDGSSHHIAAPMRKKQKSTMPAIFLLSVRLIGRPPGASSSLRSVELDRTSDRAAAVAQPSAAVARGLAT